jgi:hypothetical protein
MDKKIMFCPICHSSLINSIIKTKSQMHQNKEIFNFDQCQNCDFVFLNPRLPQEKLKHYYNSYYLPYRGSEAWGRFQSLVKKNQKKLDTKRVNLVKNYFKIQSESLIVDIGCGHPSFLKHCQQALGCRTMGLDFSDEGWQGRIEKFKDIQLMVGEISNLPKDLHPDVITMWHYLEHDYKPYENLSYLRSISTPQTKLIIEIPNFDSSSRKKFGKNWAGWHTPRHTSLFSPQNISLLLKKSGWKVKDLFTYGTMDPYLLEWMSRMEKKNIEWDKNMEDEFLSFMVGMFRYFPKKLKEKQSSLGIMTVIAEPET